MGHEKKAKHAWSRDAHSLRLFFCLSVHQCSPPPNPLRKPSVADVGGGRRGGAHGHAGVGVQDGGGPPVPERREGRGGQPKPLLQPSDGGAPDTVARGAQGGGSGLSVGSNCQTVQWGGELAIPLPCKCGGVVYAKSANGKLLVRCAIVIGAPCAPHFACSPRSGVEA